VTVEPLPEFRYHPDPVGTGAFEQLGRVCKVCGQERGWSYVFGTYGSDDLRDAVCPWCIADGSAAQRFDVLFTDLRHSIAVPAAIAPGVAEEIQQRTPGFSGWHEEQWLFHCDDGAAFLGPVGWETLEQHPDAVADVHRRLHDVDPVDAEMLVASLDVEGLATGYLFRCLHCGVHLAYADTE